MSWISDIYRSALGKKAVMAASGLLLVGFVLGHMAGNLKVFLGAEKFNGYAEWLREIGSPLLPHNGALWIVRAVLLLAVLLHIHSAWSLTLLNRAARATRYHTLTTQQATYASRTMRWGGVIVLLFVLYHLAHFTWGLSWAHPDFEVGNPYRNFVVGFQIRWVVAFYVAAQIALGFHLYHGFWSAFQTLGWDHRLILAWRRPVAAAIAVVVSLGNISLALSVLMGWVS
ncbi:MAG: succinate dehydrogenase cytochrome b subunit [Thermoanaerobaculia bacterium]